MKPCILVLTACILLCCFLGCTKTNSIPLISESNQRPEVVEPTYSTSLRDAANCRLIVNGLDITEGNYVYINHNSRNTELPILAILRALGYETEVKYNETTGVYEGIVNQTSVLFTTSEDDFGVPIPYLRSGCIRYTDGKEFYLDSASVESILYWSYNIEMAVDYDDSIIRVQSYDPNAYVDRPVKLIVNGNDITHKTNAIIRSYHTEECAILPLLIIAQELGIGFQKDESVVTLIYADKEEVIDLSTKDFGQIGAPDGTWVRFSTDNEIFMDCFTIERILTYLVDAEIYVNYDSAHISVITAPS